EAATGRPAEFLPRIRRVRTILLFHPRPCATRVAHGLFHGRQFVDETSEGVLWARRVQFHFFRRPCRLEAFSFDYLTVEANCLPEFLCRRMKETDPCRSKKSRPSCGSIVRRKRRRAFMFRFFRIPGSSRSSVTARRGLGRPVR